jgi:hypothetical protein
MPDFVTNRVEGRLALHFLSVAVSAEFSSLPG